MVRHIADLEYFVVANENDALFLEASLINKHKPRYNILLKDDKHFPYIRLGGENDITVVRKIADDGAKYFGPYFNGIRAGLLVDIIRTVYNNDVDDAAEFLQGKRSAEIREILTQKMNKARDMQQFELAIAYRDGLRCADRLGRRVTETHDDADAFTLGACRELGEILGLSRTPRKIECYDISHTAGENQVGSMTVFIDGAADKRLYRKFRIRHREGNNDFLSMAEVLGRRLARLGTADAGFGAAPDIIVIDGGKGQLSAVADMVAERAPQITVISLAKQFESIFVPGNPEPILLPGRSYALRLLQRIRDEAHRFAITYHRKLRGKEYSLHKK
jgi:excinuclease UvrABC nuclease subunit